MGSLAGEPVPAPFFRKHLGYENQFLALAQRKEVLRAFHGLAKPAQKLLHVLVAFHEINLRSVYHEQIRCRITEEEMFVGIRHRFQIFGRDLRFCGIALLRNSLQEHFRLGLQIDHKIGRGNRRRKHVEITFVKFELLIIEIEISEDFVALEEKIADDRSAYILRLRLHQTAMAFVKKIHLRTKRGAAFFLVKIAQERIVFAIKNAAGVKLFRENFCERRLADTYGPFHHDEAGRLEVRPGFIHAAGL